MGEIKELLISGHIHVALALGISIIVLSYVSKRVLSTPMKPLYQSITPLIMVASKLSWVRKNINARPDLSIGFLL